MKKLHQWIVLAVVLNFAPLLANAGGPLSLGGPNNNTPVTYPNGGSNITLNYDQGSLGGRTNAQIDAIVNQAIGLWNLVPSATVNLQQGADLNVDVDATNFGSFLNNSRDGINPVIYDSDGSIIDAMFGAGSSANVLGFAGSSRNTFTASYTEGRAVINGAISISDARLAVVFAHEIGHFFGLDHTQLDDTQGLANFDFALMYPIAFRSIVSLHEDDVSAVSALYPSVNIETFFGTLEGNFLQIDGTPIRGANIWAQNVDTGEVYSNVSDFLTEGFGQFKMLLPAGTYTLNAESIQNNFIEGSSVGPFSETITDISFQAPHPITPVQFQETVAGTPFQIQVTEGCLANVDFNLDGSGLLNNSDCVVNTPPVAETIAFTIDSTTVLSDFLPATDADGDALTFRLNASLIGSATLTLDDPSTGAFTFIPGTNNEPVGIISFTANDGIDDSNIGNVNITIIPATPNALPVAVSGNLTTNEDSPASGTLQASDADGDPLTFSIASQGSLGIARIVDSATGAYSYFPNPNANGTDSFTFSASDGFASSTATISVTIAPVNDAPVAQTGTILTLEDTPVNGVLSGSDVDGDALQFSIVTQPNGGNIQITNSSTGAFTFTPDLNANSNTSFSFQVSDGNLSDNAFVLINITPVNDAPVAQSGTLSTAEDTPVNGGFSGSDVDGDTLQFSVVTQGSLGTAVITNVNTGAFTYTPNLNANGSDTISFQVSDGNLTSTANVAVTISAVNDAPVATNSSVTTAEDSPISAVLQGSDVDSTSLQFSIINQAVFGTVVINNSATGAFTYTPNPNANGVDRFSFRVSDGVAANSASVTVTVTPVNDAPTAQASSITTDENTLVTGSLVASDIDGDTLQFSITTPPSLGTVQFVNAATGIFTYTPDLNVSGSDSFTFAVTDGVVSVSATVSVNIIAVNDAPVAQAGILSVTEDIAANGQLIASDADGDSLQFSISSPATSGNVVVTNAATGSFTYTPNANANGSDSFSFSVSDGVLSSSATVSVTIIAVNDAPVAQPLSVTTPEDTAVSGTVVASDIDNATVTYSVVNQGSLGTVTITNAVTGAFTYSPNANANGTDTFSYAASDSQLQSVAVVTVNILAVNDAPIVQDLLIATSENTPVSGTVSAISVDNDALQFSIGTQGNIGNATINASSGQFTYTPNLNQNGSDSFSVQVTDGVLVSTATVSVTINAVNTAPVAQDGTLTVNEDQPASGQLQADNVDGDPLQFSVVSQGNIGTVSIDDASTGAYTYTPNANANGSDSFSFEVTDGAFNSSATITVTVNPVNDAPVADNASITTNENSPVSGTLVANDIDGDSLQYSVVTQATLGSVVVTNAATGAFTYTPNANASGVDSFSFVANDGSINSNEALVNVTIVAAVGNNIPTISALTATPQSLLDTQTSQLQVTASDTDGPQALSFAWSVQSGGGSFNDASLANPVFTPVDVSQTQTVVLSVTVSDGQDSVSQSISLIVQDGANGGILLDDDFNDGDFVGWRIVDEGNRSAPSRWSARTRRFIQRSNIFGGSVSRNALPKPGTYALYEPGLNADDYRVRVNLRSFDNDAIGLMFRVDDSDNYYRFSWDQQRRYRRLVKNVNGNFSLLAEDSVPYVRGQNYQLEVSVQGNSIEVRIDNALIFSVEDSSLSSGTIALYNWANRASLFDNVIVEDLTGANRRPLITEVTASSLTITDAQTSLLDVNATDTDGPQALTYQWSIISGAGSLDDPTAKAPVYTPASVDDIETVVLQVIVSDGQDNVTQTLTLTVGDANGARRLLSDNFNDGNFDDWAITDQGDRQGPSRWSAVTGSFIQSSNIFGGSVKRNRLPKLGTFALYSPGFATGDYRAGVDIRSVDNDAIGLMFRVQDSDTFYRFSWDQQRSYRRLIKSVNGKVSLLAEDEVRYVRGQTYRLEVVAQGDNLEVSIDGEAIFTVNDSDISTGTIGLYNWANRLSQFDNVEIDSLAQ